MREDISDILAGRGTRRLLALLCLAILAVLAACVVRPAPEAGPRESGSVIGDAVNPALEPAEGTATEVGVEPESDMAEVAGDEAPAGDTEATEAAQAGATFIDDAGSEDGLIGPCRSMAEKVAALRFVREPVRLPTCDLFFPITDPEHRRNIRIDLASQGLQSWTELEGPLQRSLEYALNMAQDRPALKRGGMTLTWAQVVRSLEEFLDILPLLDEHPDLLSNRFVWYGMSQKPIMTGYYTPEIEASLTRQPGYEYPIYGVPSDLQYGSVRGARRFYRLEKGKVLPYYDRRDLDVRHVLYGRGLEIAWAKDPVDVFYMQVEGAGRLRLPDGTSRNVLYGAKNGYGFKSLGRIMLAKGLLPRGKLSKEHVREYFSRHPERMFQLMAENRSYVFFRLEDSPPEGTIGKPLTPMVSLATDRELLPLGSVVAFQAEIPEAENGRPTGRRTVSGIGLAQDTGTAIKGSRLDYYIGEGNDVEPIASRIMTPATVYLLISKEALING